MQITLCNNLSENNIINKSINTVTTKTCIIKGNLSVEAPVFVLQYDSTNIHNINYVKVPELNRLYYITEIIDLTGGRYEIHCKVDVLESFKTQILSLQAIIDKQENASAVNLYLDDGSFVTENKEFNRVINFPYGFKNTGEYILITAGGGGGIV